MFKNWTLGVRAIVPTIIVVLIVTAGLAFMVNLQQKNLAIANARRTAQAISKQVQAERKVYTDTVVAKLRKDGLPASFMDLKTYGSTAGAIPLPASFVHATSELVNSKGLHTVDLLSIWNINPNKGPRNQFEQEALQFMVGNQNEFKDAVVGEGDAARYVQVQADVAAVEGCVSCHNAHPNSPKKDFSIGDTMGGLVISIPLATEFAAVRSNTFTLIIISLGSILLVTVVALFFQYIFVNRPVIQAMDQLEKAADRISTGEMDDPVEMGGSDEVGRLGKAFERMRLSLKAAMDELEKRK